MCELEKVPRCMQCTHTDSEALSRAVGLIVWSMCQQHQHYWELLRNADTSHSKPTETHKL